MNLSQDFQRGLIEMYYLLWYLEQRAKNYRINHIIHNLLGSSNECCLPGLSGVKSI